jgi:hypothetical protein
VVVVLLVLVVDVVVVLVVVVVVVDVVGGTVVDVDVVVVAAGVPSPRPSRTKTATTSATMRPAIAVLMIVLRFTVRDGASQALVATEFESGIVATEVHGDLVVVVETERWCLFDRLDVSELKVERFGHFDRLGYETGSEIDDGLVDDLGAIG